jgi:hypothetical protein
MYLGFQPHPDPHLSITYYSSKESCEAYKKEFEERAKDKPEYIFWTCVRKLYELKQDHGRGSVAKVLPSN